MMQHFLQTHSVFVFFFFLFCFFFSTPTIQSLLLHCSMISTSMFLSPSLETLCEVPLTVDVD